MALEKWSIVVLPSGFVAISKSNHEYCICVASLLPSIETRSPHHRRRFAPETSLGKDDLTGDIVVGGSSPKRTLKRVVSRYNEQQILLVRRTEQQREENEATG